MNKLSLFYKVLVISLFATCVRAEHTDGVRRFGRHSPESVRRRERVRDMMPYAVEWAYTLGKLTQCSHEIIIATALIPDEEKDGAKEGTEDVREAEEADDAWEAEQVPDYIDDIEPPQPTVDLHRTMIVALDPVEYLLQEKKAAEEKIIAFYLMGARSEPEEGDRYLVFLRYREMPRAEALILGSYTGITGLINIDTDDGDDIIEVARGYIKHLRGDAFNHEAYFRFLHDLLDHPVERIRKDAKMDLMRLIDDSDAEQLIEVEKIDDLKEDIRWYTSYRRKWKTGEYQRPPPPEPSAEEIEEYRTLMQSDDREEIREGMRILRRYYHWYRANPDQWVDVALPLLEHPDLLIRLGIAQRLTTVGHPASVPVIIEDGLQHERMPSRSVSQGMLQQMLGEAIDFDPRAPEDERKEQVEAFKQWWEENKHRYEYE